ncbi:MAG: hypothetical protein ABJO01_15865 [Parasphingorhabdus sp.]|uniref:hypothetical protein n=1 Tax=Parasphingorhabdus sp. TaxID=2709688 RepID=UPI0032978CEB
MNVELEHASYQFEGYDELCLKSGQNHAHSILLIPPLFDEMNRMRMMLVDVMRMLDRKAIGCILPDLPGTNESLFPSEKANLTVWKQALSQCCDQHLEGRHIVSFRGGCLIDMIIDKPILWRFAPVNGNSLLRTMMRARIASDKEAGQNVTMDQLANEADAAMVNLAGNLLSGQAFAELGDAVPADAQSTRLALLQGRSQPADIHLAGSALWLRAEPERDLVLSQAVADDIADWISA